MKQAKRSRLFEAKWPGTCKKCGKPWRVKDMLCYESDVLVHASCPRRKGGFKELLISKEPDTGGYNVPVEVVEEELPPSKTFVPSVYQQGAFNWAKYEEGNAVMEAVAGSGKTTTIVNMLDILPSHLRILFVAFNRDIVKELKARLPKHIKAFTLNSLGFAVIRKCDEFQDLDEDKVSGIMNEFWPISKREVEDPKVRSDNRVKRSAMRKIVSLIKNTLADYNDPNAILDIIDRYRIEVDELMEQEVIERVPYVMEKNNSDLETVDYDDQIYLPVTHPRLQNLFDQYDFILGDECQDWNAANIQLLLKHLAPGGRMLAVGDRKQSINGFRGADIHAIDHLIEALNAKTLPLSICYRCPRSHVDHVRPHVPQIEAAPDAKEGTLGDLKYDEMMDVLKEKDMVLCRTNAPLVKPAFTLIKKGIKAIIKGKKIGEDLVNYIDRFQCDDLGRLDILMQEHTEHEVARYLEKNKEMMAEQVKERYETIVEVARECNSVEQLTTRLITLFSDENIGVVFSSIHRAKGLEANRIFFFRPDLVPHPKAKKLEDLEQEENMLVVALTRSKDTLYMVSGWE